MGIGSLCSFGKMSKKAAYVFFFLNKPYRASNEVLAKMYNNIIYIFIIFSPKHLQIYWGTKSFAQRKTPFFRLKKIIKSAI